MPLESAPLVAFDTETTGLDPWSGDRIVTIAMVHATLDGAETRDVLALVVDPERSVPEGAAKIHGITDKVLAELRESGSLPLFAEVKRQIAVALAGRVPLAYNLTFDAQFVRQAFGKPKPDAGYAPEGLDPRYWAPALWPKGHRLGEVCQRLGVELDGWHNALVDTHAALGAARAMLPLLRAKKGLRFDTVADALALQRHHAAEIDAHYRRRRRAAPT